VASVNQDCGNACDYEDPTIATVYQADTPEQLQYMSWTSPSNPPDQSRYYFDDSAGEGIKTYIIDTGAAMNHEVGFAPFVDHSSANADTSSPAGIQPNQRPSEVDPSGTGR
jgi:hypothetical protein